ncbi:Transcriptional regulator, contains XRE-family HTH domain [Pseudooceanicola antarcticus]|uniref:Transcriptional regulator, contains XRE-family HTH domain n=1 Tax=Pseudooceanicola antarcticus TaxID=1247613 RepID=A0A285JCM3_9RHOB|nr:helix-turn-helix transcriptional regulator [Pseudooceanicola antarcticus]PJE30805.1 XRE family transcriptional regulator [Pseudooceanicola antarcticus]SNY57136.1 Transcriptional regulator, contains XRE-family HTH domain [Pseudooceanicola antarcticus]
MMDKVDKRERAHAFRHRLREAMGEKAMSQSALARRVGVDRSTISQLLSGDSPRLPNAQVVAECAAALGVSADWLLALSERPETAADLLAASSRMTEAPRALIDEQIFAWHQEAEGYKIRHVPAALPDMLKANALLEWEYSPHLGRTTQQAIGASADKLSWMRNASSDYEIALPRHEMIAFATATGYYADVPADIRAEQIDRFADLLESLYPRMRMYLFDARRLYSSPVTIFGPLLSVLYIGQNYIAFRDTERVQAMTAHFDYLVREASVASRVLPEYLRELKDWI